MAWALALSAACAPAAPAPDAPVVVVVEPSPATSAALDDAPPIDGTGAPPPRKFWGERTCTRHTDVRANREEAKKLYRDAIRRLDAGDFHAAAVAFETADCLVPSPMPKWNVARCYDRLGDACRALEWYRRYQADLAHPGVQSTSRSFATEAQERIAALAPRCR